jgi:branched-chain amino acid aminotransferase
MKADSATSGVTRVISGAGVEGTVAPRDRGFLLGDGLFETVRVYGGKPFRLQQHLARMRSSAQRLMIPVPERIEDEIAAALSDSAVADKEHARLRITLSRGESDLSGLLLDETAQPTLVIMMDPIAPVRRTSMESINVAIAGSRRNEQALSAGHKITGFMDAIVELALARKTGADDCLFLDSQGHVSECSASNIFIHDGETLVTPSLGCGALPGITRSAVLELAGGMGLPVEERVVEKEELFICREAFLTSSVREIVGIGRVGDMPLGVPGAAAGRGGRAGELTIEIGRKYAELVRAECGSD